MVDQDNAQPMPRPPAWNGTDAMTDGGLDRGSRIRCLGEALATRGLRLAVAESCTGGLLAANLTDQAGSSSWFEGGWVTYSNRAKQRDLAVPSSLFAEVGAVSGEVVTAMARGAIERADVDYAVAISGVAGPGGGSDTKPVGTVWIGWGYRAPTGSDATQTGATTFASRFRFPGERQAVREAAVEAALQGLCAHLGGKGWSQQVASEWSSAHWPAAGLKWSED
ncbi:CinA family protein [Guyparkeria sp. SCN-R1]|uniref:CinA family protein n=1 Tax=Guyparkeria sp. SCN-R1 TaxID=2341113 RepID=UPI001F009E55|nr:CinA family protein [Guyparkeria sp. SCN-R1]